MQALTLDELNKINLDFNYFQPKLEKLVTFDNMVAEANFLNTLEDTLPESDFFDLHFDMIIEGKVGQYHKALNTGKNILLEKANVPNELKAAVNEAIEDLKIYITNTINENQALALGAPSADFGNIAPHAPNKSSGIWSVLKGIWDALTEGGSVIGIIQFLIDIVGIVGDFIFPGVGVVMDLLNALIYAVRGKWLLCIISIIAAVVIGGGDMLKVFKPYAKIASPIFVKLTAKGGAKEAAELAAKAGAKGGMAVKLLSKIGDLAGGALAKAGTLLTKFMNGIGKVVGKIPGLGGLLEPIFVGIGRVFEAFAGKMTLFSSNLKVMSKEGAEMAVKDLEKAIANGATTQLSADAKYLKIIKDGKVTTIPSKFISKTGHFAMTYTKDGASILFKNSDDFLKTWSAMQKTFANPAVNKSFSRKFSEFLLKWRKGAKAAKVNFKLIIGKAIYHYIFGEEWKEGGKWTREEVEGHGNGAFNDWIDRKISEEREKTGAIYVPSVILDGNNAETYDRISDYQNHFANITGKPNIIEAVREKSSKEKTDAEFNAFFNDIASGKVKNTGAGDVTKSDNYTEVIKQNKPRMTESRIQTVSSFSYFKKS
jgi:hypothetical protein